MVSHAVQKITEVSTKERTSCPVYMPAARNPSVKNVVLSTSCPATVEPIMRNHPCEPPVYIFNFARTYELVSSPPKKPKMVATAMTGLARNITLNASLDSKYELD